MNCDLKFIKYLSEKRSGTDNKNCKGSKRHEWQRNLNKLHLVFFQGTQSHRIFLLNHANLHLHLHVPLVPPTVVLFFQIQIFSPPPQRLLISNFIFKWSFNLRGSFNTSDHKLLTALFSPQMEMPLQLTRYLLMDWAGQLTNHWRGKE